MDKLTQDDALVKMTNDMARVKWSIKDATTVKILLCLISCIEENDDNSEAYTYPIDLILPYIGKRHHQRIYKACETLAKSTLIRINPQTGRTHHTPIFKDVIDRREDGFIEGIFNESIKPYLFELKSQYTSFSLKEGLRLTSTYSRILFLVLSSYNKTNSSIILSLADYLHERLDVPQSMRVGKNAYQNFRRRVLEPVTEELNEKTSLKFTWEPVRTSHNVTHINFLFSSSPDKNIINQPSQDEATKKQRIAFLKKLGFSFENAEYMENLIAKAGLDFDTYLSRVLHYYNRLPKDKQINKAGYIRTSVERDCQYSLPFENKEPAPQNEVDDLLADTQETTENKPQLSNNDLFREVLRCRKAKNLGFDLSCESPDCPMQFEFFCKSLIA